MKIKMISTSILSLCLMTISLTGCGSNNDMEGNQNTGEGNTSGVIPDNTDSGKNNTSTPDDTGNTDPSASPASWNLIFEDNFEGSDSIPDTSKWTLAPQGDDTWNRYMSESYGQAYQKDGYLYLFGMMNNGEYLTGGIETRDKFDFKYGQVKCRARFLRQPKGNHTGIWMMPEPPAEKWPMSGEIDIMEHLGDDDIVHETVHNWWADELDNGNDPMATATASVDNYEFNVYGLIWDENSISFTVNGEVQFTYENLNLEGEDSFYQWPYIKPFYLILSQSLGGKGTWAGEIDNKELPAIFQIDWIKVWQKAE